jgi:hypothetical protein
MVPKHKNGDASHLDTPKKRSSHAHFFIGSLVLGEFSFLSSLYILVISPLSDV